MPEEEEKERYLSAEDDGEAWSRVLKESTQAMEEEGIPYATIGSIATTAMGYEESCHDIDIQVAPEDADRALDALASRGYETSRPEPEWLYKAVKDDVLVDLIFRVGDDNEMFADEETFKRTAERDVFGQRVRVISPEDFLVMQAVSNKADAPDYWFKGLKAASCDDLDWDYLLERAAVAPVRVLSLLLYARSDGNEGIPDRVVEKLYEAV